MTSEAAVAAAAASTTAPNAAAAAAPAGGAAAATQSGAPSAPGSTTTAPVVDKTSLLDDKKEGSPAGEKKPADEGKPAPKAGEKGAPDPNALPEFKLPTGIEADPAIMPAFQEFAKKNNLTPEQGQGAVDFFQEKVAPLLAEARTAPLKAWDDLNTQWANEVMADPVIGGKNWEANKTNISKTIDTFGGQNAAAIKQALAFTGAGNNPVILRFLSTLSKQLSESGQLKGGNAPSTPKTAAQLLYPHQGKETS